MKMHLIIPTVALLSCGGKSGSNESLVGSLNSIDASFFEKIIAPNISSTQLRTQVNGLSLSVNDDLSDSAKCFYKQIKFKEMIDGKNNISEDEIDVTSCLSKTDADSLQGIPFKLKMGGYTTYKVDNTVVDANNMTVFDYLSSRNAETRSWDENYKIIMRVVLKGTISSTKQAYELETDLLEECRSSQDQNGVYTDGAPCNRYFYEISKLEGKTTGEILVTRTLPKNVSLAKGATYYDAGSVENFKINNWTGTITHRGGDEKPDANFTNGSETMKGQVGSSF